VAGVGDDAVQVVAYFGDATGDGSYSSLDTVKVSRTAAGADTGFAAYPLADPLILADIDANGRLDAGDAAHLDRFINGLAEPRIPVPPVITLTQSPGPDPALSIPSNLTARPGSSVLVPINLDDPHPAGSTGLTQATLALQYDPAVFALSAADVQLGSIPAAGSGWQLEVVVDQAAGKIAITLFSTTPIAAAPPGSLVTIDFHVRPEAPLGVSALSLVPSFSLSSVPGGVFSTALADDQGALTLAPLPTVAAAAGGVEVEPSLLDEPLA
jgi:hypothetical protein